MTRIVQANDQAIKEAADILKKGGLVAMPTETVYGLAANAQDPDVVTRLYAAKDRPVFNPLITHFPSAVQASHYAEFDRREIALADAFWPGPLTLVLPRRLEADITELAMAGLPTMAVRAPNHPVAQALLKAVDFPLVAPSANKSGKLSPTTPAHVAESLGDAVDLILAAGPCKVGLESTVLDLTEDVPTILRPGAITAEEIARVLDMDVSIAQDNVEEPKSPGLLLRHYAPDTPLRLNAIDLEPGEALLAFGSAQFMGIKGGGRASDLPEEMHRNLSEEGDLHEAAANLFAMLKDLDKAGAKGIAVMSIPEQGLGVAINDRLRRAAAS